MFVTKMVELKKGKYKIYLNDEFAFALYKSELRLFSIKIGMELTQEIHDKIYGDILYKRAKTRVLHLLEKMDRTEFQLRTKLKESFYPGEVVDRVMQYVNEQHYVDDEKYVGNFINMHHGCKSKQQIMMQLYQKGVEKQVITNALEQSEFDEKEAIRRIILKKHYQFKNAEKEELQKMKAYLYRKGFSYDVLNSVICEMSCEES